MMGMFLNRGCEVFEDVVNSRIYVDKTDMLDVLNTCVNTEQRYVCVTRPRRFGKSITANMLMAYYGKGCDARPLFEKRKLGSRPEWDRYLNAFDVLRFDIGGICATIQSVDGMFSYIHDGLLDDLTEAFPDVELSPDMQVADWLDVISLKKKTRFVIIIDEWDSIFRDEPNNLKAQEQYVQFLRSLFKNSNSGRFLALGYLTGILPIKRYRSESSLNNFREYTMLTPGRLAPYIGFNTREVRDLCETWHMNFDQALEWYDGYLIGHEHICAPNSIVIAMDSQEYAGYWTNTGLFTALKDYITMDLGGLRDAVTQMIGGQHVPVRVRGFQNDMTILKNRDDVLTLLIHLGYLAYDADHEEAFIPNREIRQYFEDTLEETGWDDLVQTIQESEELLQLTQAGDADAVAEALDACHTRYIHAIHYNKENSLACCIQLAYYAARKDYLILQEQPAGRGFADIIFLPKKNVTLPAMVVELKWNQSADTAISQIKNQKYPDALAGYQGEILLVGVSYQKEGPEAKQHTCRIEKWERKKDQGESSP